MFYTNQYKTHKSEELVIKSWLIEETMNLSCILLAVPSLHNLSEVEITQTNDPHRIFFLCFESLLRKISHCGPLELCLNLAEVSCQQQHFNFMNAKCTPNKPDRQASKARGSNSIF